MKPDKRRFFLLTSDRLDMLDRVDAFLLAARNDPDAWRQAQRDAQEALHVHAGIVEQAWEDNR